MVRARGFVDLSLVWHHSLFFSQPCWAFHTASVNFAWTSADDSCHFPLGQGESQSSSSLGYLPIVQIDEGFLKWGYTEIIHYFGRIFHFFNQSFWGTPLLWTPQMIPLCRRLLPTHALAQSVDLFSFVQADGQKRETLETLGPCLATVLGRYAMARCMSSSVVAYFFINPWLGYLKRYMNIIYVCVSAYVYIYIWLCSYAYIYI